ncbi:Mth938-like domain-containing protein [Sphingomonas sp.]|uniref:Mth938-like domain-containing protein n=1 Tax=Sphingomonas sp. TaxID=28214 RepID=UPI0035C7A384
MRLDTAPQNGGPVVRAFGPAGYLVDERRFAALLMTTTDVFAWTPPPLAGLAEADLAPLLDPAPEFILLGTGDALARPPRALVQALEARGIGLDPMDSRAAARAWAVLRAESRSVAMALYPLP